MRNEPIKIEEYKGYVIKSFFDEDPCNPRDDDNLGTIAAYHRRYDLRDGDAPKTVDDLHEFLSKELPPKEEWTLDEDGYRVEPERERREDVLVLPLSMMDHSGISVWVGQPNCPWDSGRIGVIYVEHDKILKEYGDLSPETLKKAEDCLRAEVETWNRYLTGQVFGFVVEDPLGEMLDSCWGYYYEKDALEEARSAVDHAISSAQPLNLSLDFGRY